MAIDQKLKEELIQGAITAAEFVYAHLPASVQTLITVQQIEQALADACELAYLVCPYVPGVRALPRPLSPPQALNVRCSNATKSSVYKNITAFGLYCTVGFQSRQHHFV